MAHNIIALLFAALLATTQADHEDICGEEIFSFKCPQIARNFSNPNLCCFEQTNTTDNAKYSEVSTSICE